MATDRFFYTLGFVNLRLRLGVNGGSGSVMVFVKRVIRLLGAVPFTVFILAQPASGETLMASGWQSVAATIQRFEERGDYRSAFYALDEYIKRRVELFYPNSFSDPAFKPRLSHVRQKAGSEGISALWNTIAWDAEEFGRKDPIIGYDYAALGEAYTALNDPQQARTYYLEATKILTAALMNHAPTWISIHQDAARLLAARESYFEVFEAPGSGLYFGMPSRW
jgi:tetratricopeptide (TPR) repeat protein